MQEEDVPDESIEIILTKLNLFYNSIRGRICAIH